MLESIYKPKQENEYFEVYRKSEILMAIKTNKNMIKLKNQFTEKFKQHHHIYTKLKGLKNAWEWEKSQASSISRKKINKNDIIVL